MEARNGPTRQRKLSQKTKESLAMEYDMEKIVRTAVNATRASMKVIQLHTSKVMRR